MPWWTDYHDWIHLEILDDPEHFLSWLRANFLNAENASFLYPGDRYRPFWEFYNAVAWQVFGPTPWLHHLSRWFFHFGAVLTFAAAFWHISRAGWREKAAGFDHGGFAALLLFMPLALLVYIWLFFPNVPAARLGPQEVYSVFFLGLCNWMAALLLVGNAGDSGKGRWRQSTWLHYALFMLGYLGLVTAKEVGIAAAPVAVDCLVFCGVAALRDNPERAAEWLALAPDFRAGAPQGICGNTAFRRRAGYRFDAGVVQRKPAGRFTAGCFK